MCLYFCFLDDSLLFEANFKKKKEMNLFTLTPSVMFVNFRLALYCSCQRLWNNPVWLVSSNFLPTLQLTKLHQLAMQHIPLPSLGQSNPTFPGTYPRLPGGSPSIPLSSLLFESHHQNTPVTSARIKDVYILSEFADSLTGFFVFLVDGGSTKKKQLLWFSFVPENKTKNKNKKGKGYFKVKPLKILEVSHWNIYIPKEYMTGRSRQKQHKETPAASSEGNVKNDRNIYFFK